MSLLGRVPTEKRKRQSFQSLYFLGFAVAIGILAAFGALCFRILIEIFQTIFWEHGETFIDKVHNTPWWMIVLIPATGGLIAGPIITFFVPEAKGPGVPEVILSVARRQSTIRHRVTFLKSFLSSLLIGAGASVGREGPIVQIGASVGSSVAQIFRLDPDLRRVCLASGAAAGISATFNAPIAGTLFALEIILLDIDLSYISHIIVSAVTASVISRIFLGEFPSFQPGVFHLSHYWELLIYLALGILAGFVAIGFMRMLSVMDGLFSRVSIPEWSKPAVGGLILGLLALKLPDVLGVGYHSVNLALSESLSLKMAAVLVIGKILATALSIGSGMSGGIFAPSLVLGATLGTTLALSANLLFPELSLGPGNYVLAGMGAVVAGTTLAPITAIVTIFELTYSYQIVLPLMIACISSSIVVRVFFGYSVYEMKLLKQGVNIVRGHDAGILRYLSVKDHLTKEFETIRDSTKLLDIRDKIVQSRYPHFVVLNENGELSGVLSLRDIKDSLDKFEELKEIVIAADLMTHDVVTISILDNLENAIHLFEQHRISFMPVNDPWNPKRVLGILKRDDLLQAYKESVLKDRILSASLK